MLTPTPLAQLPPASARGQQTRDKIIQAAHRLFVEQGYHGTSMRRIASESGIALSSIYNHFPSKEALFSTVLDDYHPYHEILLTLKAVEVESVEDFVREGAASMLTALERRPDFLNLMFVEIVEFKSQHIPQIFQKIFPQVLTLVQLFAGRQDTLRPIPIPHILRAFIGLFFSYYVTESLLGKQMPAGMKQNAFEHFVDIYLHGIMADGAA
ncbi:MAG TPA: TetR/AcrR family transcriptional regulator [Anaerolineales bacterium]|nr:TetR/AcrR family transcriptional regulator [Anaerolineales bacterium]